MNSINSTDKKHLTQFIDNLGHPPKEAAFADDGRLIKLDLSKLGLRELPPEIGRSASMREGLDWQKFSYQSQAVTKLYPR